MQDTLPISHPRFLTGYIFRKKPLYVAIAQRKDERQAQLQLHYAQHLAGLAGPPTFIPGGYPPLYYAPPPAVVSHVSPQPGMMYQPMDLRPGWTANGFAPPTRPGFQHSPLPVVSTVLLIKVLLCWVAVFRISFAEHFHKLFLRTKPSLFFRTYCLGNRFFLEDNQENKF